MFQSLFALSFNDKTSLSSTFVSILLLTHSLAIGHPPDVPYSSQGSCTIQTKPIHDMTLGHLIKWLHKKTVMLSLSLVIYILFLLQHFAGDKKVSFVRFFHLDTPVGRIVFPSFGYCWMPPHFVPPSSRVPCIPTNSLKCMCVTAYLWVVTEDNTICNNWCSALHSGDLSAKRSPQSPCRYLTFSLTEVYNTSTDTARIYSMIRLWLNLIACVPDLSA